MGIIPSNVPIGEPCDFTPNAPLLDNDWSSGTRRERKEVLIGNCLLGYHTVRKYRRNSKWSHFKGRTAEIEKLIRHRHGPIIPETDDAFIYLEVICNLTYVEFDQDHVKVALEWAARWLPWATKKAVEDVIYDRTQVRFRSLSADALGHALHVSYEERCLLDLRTIGSFDVTKRQRTKIRKAKRRDRDRHRKMVKRRSAGAVTRAEYLAKSLSQSKPWEAFGVCRRTWEKRGRPVPVDRANDHSEASSVDSQAVPPITLLGGSGLTCEHRRAASLF